MEDTKKTPSELVADLVLTPALSSFRRIATRS